MVTLKKIGEKELVQSSGTVTLKKIQAGAQTAPQPVGNSGVTLKKIEPTNHMPTLQVERANEQDKMLVPSVSRQAAQNTPNVVKGKFTGNRQTTYTEPTLGERLRSIGAGAVKQYAGSVAEIPALTVEQQKGTLATGVYREQAAALDKQIAALERSLADPTMTARDIAETNEALKIAREQRGIYGKAVEANEKTGTLAREASQSLTASGAADIENAQKGLGTLGKIAVQAGTAGIQMGMDAALGLATGGGSMLPMVVRSFGGGVQEAAQKGYSTQQQIALGLTTAATEYFTEKLFGGNPVYDTDVGLINRLVGKIAGNGKLMAALNSMPADMLSEGLEEVIADILEPTAEYLITGNKDFATVDQIIADGATGVLLSALGIGGKKLGGVIAQNAQNAAPNGAGARAEATEGNLTGMAQNAPQHAAESAEMPKAKGLRELEEVKGWNEEAAAGVTLKKVQPTDNDAYKTAKKLGNLTGKKVAWFTETADGTGGTKNGFYDRGTNTIWLNTESGDTVAKIFSHELTHAIEQSEQYESFKQLVFDRKTELGEDIEAQRRAKRALYERHGVNLQSEAEIDSEILAEYVENNLLTNEKEIRRICQTNRSIGQSVLDWINKQLAKLGFRDAKERVYLENAKQLYAEALAESNRTSQRDLDEARAELFESLQRGEITQEEYDDAVQGIDIGREAMEGVQFSFGGRNANAANIDALRRAQEMAKEGVAVETIFRETGWYTGADGKWRFEIDDSGMKYHSGGDALFSQNHPEYAEYQTLLGKMLDGSITDAEQERLTELDEIWGREYGRLSERVKNGNATLEDILQHDELFENYPQLRKAKIEFRNIGSGTAGQYNNRTNTITLSDELIGTTERTLIHEIQHAIQNQEGFARGASPDYWKNKINRAHLDVMNARYEFDHQRSVQELNDKIVRGEIDEELFDEELERIMEEDPDAREKYDAMRRAEWLESRVTSIGSSADALYRNTAGEIEARDTARRRPLTAEERRNRMPDTGNEDTVFAEDGGYAMSQSKQDSVKKQLQEHQDELNNKKTVATISDNGWRGMSTGAFRKKIVEDLKITGYRVENQSIGTIEFDEKLLNRSLNYIQTDAEAAAYQALPQVLKRGIEISGHDDHKERGYETLTIAAPVILNGKRGNMAVVVMKTKGNRYKVHRILTPEGETFELPEMANAESTSAGGITEAAKATGVVTPTIDSASDDSITDTAENSKREFSISEDSEDGGNKDLIFGKTYGMTSNDLAENVYGMTYEEKLRAGMSERNKLPTKAKNALVRNERYATVAIGEKLGVPKAAQREYMTPLVQELSEEYLKTGSVSKETQDRIFETAYENGIVADNAFYEQYKDVKQKLRGTRVQISEEDTHDIPDYGTWKKSVFGTLNIVKDGGIPVDVLYEEMADMAPELFPTNVIAPSDMLVKMAEVGKSIKKAEKTLEEYYGKDAEEYKRWMRNDFDAAVNRQLSELKTIKAYAEDKNNKIRGPKQITTQEELKDAYMTLKDARRAYEKVNNKALLTDSDKAKVGQLLRGEITLEALNPETDNVKDIKAVYEAKKPYEEVTRVIRDYNKQREAGLRDVADLFLQTANDWKDKKAGIAYSRETMERNVRDIVPDKELADAIVDTYFKPVHDAQAASTRMKNEFRDRIRKLDLSRKIDEKGGNCVSEAYAVQLYGEAMDNIKMLENSRGKLKMRDGKTLADWQGVVTDLWKENPALDRGKVEMAVEEFRDAYDELFEKMNETRLRNGYEPINYRKGYFPHFQPQQSDGLLGLFGKAIGLQTEVTALPTSINGITHMFKPGIQWFGNAQERLGFSTAYDAVEGFDRYIEGAADVIYQTDNIQKLRALASQVRYRTSDEGIQKQVDEVMASDKLSEEEKKDVIDAIYENGRFKLSNFAVELDEYTNILANKKSKADRSMEQMLGRNMYNVVKAFESRVAANMVAVNPASWLTNFIPITQAWGAVDSRYILSGMWGTLKNYRTSDGMKEVSTFLTNREGSEPLVRTKAQEWSAELSKPMEWIDQFTAGSIVRARFLQNTDRGMSAAEAISDADAFAASVMADRSKGSMPTLFHQSNPLMKALTQFQLEQNNQLSYVFKDLPRDKREEGVKRLVAALLKFFLGAYLYNNVYEFFIGRRPALDPIGILNDSVGDWTGYELPSVAEAIDGMANGERFSEQFRTEKKGRVSALGGAAERTLEELPFVGGLLGGGRVPISSALPDWKNLGKAVFSEDMNAKKRLSTIVKELTGPASYIVLPFGGGQIKKIAQGEYATVRGGSYTVDSKGREVLQYPVYTDTEADIFKNVFVTGLFGKTATKEGQAWIESGFKNLSANETQAYKDMREFETQKKAYALIKETKAVGREAGYKEEVAKILLGSGVNGDAKAELFYNVYAADGEKEKIDAMTEAGATRWEATKMILESKTKDASLETLMMSSKDLTDAEKAEIFLNKFATETQKDAYERDGKSISKTTYYKFISATEGLSSDKDADGKTVKGKSKKDKVLKVINGMDLTVAQKDALYYAAGYKESTLMQDAPWYNLKFRGQE